MIKALLFDYGGTLDTAANHWFYVIASAYEACSLSISEEVLREAYVYGERMLAKKQIIFPEDDFLTLLSKKMDLELAYLEANGWLHLGEGGAREGKKRELAEFCDAYARAHTRASSQVLEELSGRFPLVMVSNFYGNLHTVLKEYGLSRFFFDVVESAVVGVRKPDPRIWALGAQRAGFLPEETLAIGDSYTKDVLPAAEAGCQTLWFHGTDWQRSSFDESVPGYVIYALEELLSLPCLKG